MSAYYPVKYKEHLFNCPYCGVYTYQHWGTVSVESDYIRSELVFGHAKSDDNVTIQDIEVSCCNRCDHGFLWLKGKILYPHMFTASPCNEDLPDDVKKIYREAGAIAGQSPRAACALLRLAVEMLLKDLGETGNINDGIKNLVKKGLDPIVQQSFDIVRITGNNAVHAGKIEFDDATNVHDLFNLINVIAYIMITHPKRVQETYNKLPQDSRDAIAKRDGNKK